MSYQTDFICTYKLMEDEFSQDYLYRVQLLQAFGMERWNDENINVITNDTFNIIKDTEIFREIIETAKQNKDMINILTLICNENINNETINQDELVFELLFKYEFFDLTHKCLCEQLRCGRVCESTKDVLLNVLRKKD
jgi:hypothetical protein